MTQRTLVIAAALLLNAESARAANNEIYATIAIPPIVTSATTYFLSDGNVYADYSDETTTPGYLDGPELAVFDGNSMQSNGCAANVTSCANISTSDAFLSSAGVTRPRWGSTAAGQEVASVYYVLRDAARTYFDANDTFGTLMQDLGDRDELVVMVNRPSTVGCSSCMRPSSEDDLEYMIFRGDRPQGPAPTVPYYDRPKIFLSDNATLESKIPVHEFGHYYNRVVVPANTAGAAGFRFNQDIQEMALDEGLGYWYSSDYANTYFTGRWDEISKGVPRPDWQNLYPTYNMFKDNTDAHYLGDVITSALWHAREEAGCNKVLFRRAVLERVNSKAATAFASSDAFGTSSIVRGFAFEFLSQAVSSGACSDSAARKVAKIFAAHQLLPSFVDQSDAGGLNQAQDNFGHAVATGDFDRDGYEDLAVGSPYEDDGSTSNVGVVRVFYGSSAGVVTGGFNRTETINQTLSGAALEAGDLFGYSLAGGDFNRDGYSDLAVGSPYEDIGSVADAGFVQVFYGSAAGLVPANVEAIDQSTLGSSVEASDHLGHAIQGGDFNHDGYGDLAIGSPGEDLAGGADAGYVFVLYGSSQGLLPISLETFRQSDLGSDDGAGDQFGFTFTSGDFDRDGYSDLVVGTPYEDESGVVDSGFVFVLYGSYAGLSPIRYEKFSQASVGSVSEDDDRFGRSLAAGDFNHDGHSDLAIAAPYEDYDGAVDTGFIFVMYGGAGGLLPASYAKWDQAASGWANESYDRFGWALSAGDTDGDGIDDLIVGNPYEDIGSVTDAGFIDIYRGSGSGLSASRVTAKDQSFWGSTQSPYDQLGYSLATGDFDNDGKAEIAAGARGKSRDGASSAGVVYVDRNP